MLSKTLPLTLLALLTAAVSCKKRNWAPASVPTPATVYVSGYSGATGQPTAGTWWKNGAAEAVPNTGAIYGITVSGSDVYWLGDSAYWKNGVVMPVPGAAGLSSIFVSGSDVYLTGFTAASHSSATAAAVYWKNGVMTNLTQNVANVTAASANSIYVLNSDVYVAGCLAVNNQPAAGVYWKNGVVNEVPHAVNLTAIVVSSAHIVVAGEVDTSGQAFWVDNSPSPGGRGTRFTSLYLSPRSDLYVTGFYTDPGDSMAVYWSNTGLPNWIDMEVTYLPKGILANGIVVSGSDVYVSGSNANGQAIYWKNGVTDTLGHGGATGIAVAK